MSRRAASAADREDAADTGVGGAAGAVEEVSDTAGPGDAAGVGDAAGAPVALCAALADESRWQILQELGRADRSASELATAMPISRQAIARHLGQLEAVGLVEAYREGKQIRYRALGSRLSTLARQLDTIARGWDRRLDRLRTLAETTHADSGHSESGHSESGHSESGHSGSGRSGSRRSGRGGRSGRTT